MLNFIKCLTVSAGRGKKKEEMLSQWDVEFLSEGGMVGRDCVSSGPVEAFVNFNPSNLLLHAVLFSLKSKTDFSLIYSQQTIIEQWALYYFGDVT